MTASSPTAENLRFWRYLAPNLITAISIVFGLASLAAAHAHAWEHAAWLIVYAVLTDRLDGLVARAVRGTSELGMQLDSFADFLNFGVAPAFLMHTYLSGVPTVVDTSAERLLLHGSCAIWVLGAVFRLARFNVISDDQVPTKIFFGIPTTLAGGLLVMWFLTCLKYSEVGETFGGPRVFGQGTVSPAVWGWFPVGMIVGAYLMSSSLRMPKLVSPRNKALMALMMINVIIGYVGGFARYLPEVLVLQPTAWILLFLVWGQTSAKARALKPPRLFPPSTDQQPKVRSQEDMASDGEGG